MKLVLAGQGFGGFVAYLPLTEQNEWCLLKNLQSGATVQRTDKD